MLVYKTYNVFSTLLNAQIKSIKLKLIILNESILEKIKENFTMK